MVRYLLSLLKLGFKGSPAIQYVEVVFTPDHEATLSAFEQDLIDIVYTEVMDLGKYTKDKSATIYEIPTQKYEFIGINFENEVLASSGVREALLYALDREQLIDIYYLGQGSVTDTPISPNSHLYDTSSVITKYDKETARLLLAKEGYDIIHIAFTSGMSGSYNSNRLGAEEVMEDYPDVKITVIDSLCASLPCYQRMVAIFLSRTQWRGK